MAIAYPTGMRQRAIYIEGAVSFRLNCIRNSKRLLKMTDEELIAEREARGIPVLFGMSLESERCYAEQTVAKGFRMQDVRDYASDIRAEHGCVPERF